MQEPTSVVFYAVTGGTVRALDLIVKTRDRGILTAEEIRFLINGYLDGSIPEYQISAWLMSVFFVGMDAEQIGHLTREMIRSGDTLRLPRRDIPYVDKHSTGGVGDKVSLILAPAVAACGVPVPMMSGRALGHTGGTLDKLDTIPGYSTHLSPDEFVSVIEQCGFAMTGQSDRVVPADKRLYALRDVTGTVESVPLITASIVSKKAAEGAQALVFDVKCGKGAFMKTIEEARELAESLVSTCRALEIRAVAVITSMEAPLGYAVGNFLEVEESLAVLRSVDADPRSRDLVEVTVRLGSWMLVAAGVVPDVAAGEKMVRDALTSGAAADVFRKNVAAQGGDNSKLDAMLGTFRPKIEETVTSDADGVVVGIDAFRVGMAGVYLGVGRSVATDAVLPDVGVVLHVKPGDRVKPDDPICTVFAATRDAAARARQELDGAFDVASDREYEPKPIIREEITAL